MLHMLIYYIIYVYYIYIYIYIYIYQAHMHVLKIKSKITRNVNCFIPGTSTSKGFFKEIESVSNNVPDRCPSL